MIGCFNSFISILECIINLITRIPSITIRNGSVNNEISTLISSLKYRSGMENGVRNEMIKRRYLKEIKIAENVKKDKAKIIEYS